MKLNARLTLLAAMAAISLGGMPLKAAAQAGGQDEIGNQVIATLDLQDVDIRDAIRALFKNVNANYVVQPEVQGTVTITLKNIKFDVALRNILDQVKATYRIEGGMYTILKREEPIFNPGDPGPVPLTQPALRTARIYIGHSDPGFIIRMLAAAGTSSVQFPEYSTIQNGMLFGGGGGNLGRG